MQIRLFSSEQEKKPATFEYQAPKDDNYKNFESTKNFFKRYCILFPIAAYAIYNLSFCTKNQFSKKTELKFFGPFFESKILGPFVTKKIQKKFDGNFYRQDTEEVKLVSKIMNDMIEANSLQDQLRDVKIKLIHDETLILYMNPDGNLFLTIKCIQVAKENEQKLALLICHEVSHYLLGHQAQRLANGYFAINFRKHMKMDDEVESYDPVREEFKQKVSLQKYSYFYPHQRVFNKYYQRNCDTFAINLWKQIYGDKFSQEELCQYAHELYEVEIPNMIGRQPNLSWLPKKGKHIDYDYKRGQVVDKLIKAKYVTEEGDNEQVGKDDEVLDKQKE